MKKHFSLLFALLFLMTMASSLWHEGKHGFAEHEHGGHRCGIHMLVQHSPADIATPPAGLPAPSVTALELSYSTPSVAAYQHRLSATARAPPVLS